MTTEWITPSLVLLVGAILWREIHRIHDRMDRHLDGHPK